jgi:hypothetical protein
MSADRDLRIYEQVQVGLDRIHELGGDADASVGEVAQQVADLYGVNVVDVLKIVEQRRGAP